MNPCIGKVWLAWPQSTDLGWACQEEEIAGCWLAGPAGGEGPKGIGWKALSLIGIGSQLGMGSAERMDCGNWASQPHP